MLWIPLLLCIADGHARDGRSGFRGYAEVQPMVKDWTISAFVNAEYRLGILAVSAAVGPSYSARLFPPGIRRAWVGRGQAHLFLGRVHQVEGALGVGSELRNGELSPFPTAFVGYRFERPDRGFLFRIGPSWGNGRAGFSIAFGFH